MDQVLTLLWLILWSSGLRTEEIYNHSQAVRLVGGARRCAGTLEVKQGEWRPVFDSDWTLREAAVVCRDLDCGSTVSLLWRQESWDRPVWGVRPGCVRSESDLRDCVRPASSVHVLEVTCSDLLARPIISVSVSGAAASDPRRQQLQVLRGSNFSVLCSARPQFPGGSFLLSFSSSHSAHDYTQPAVNHSAHFLFPAADHAHQGNYCCVYRANILSHNFSSQSRRLSLTVSDLLLDDVSHRVAVFPPVFVFALVLLLLSLTLYIAAVSCSCTATRGQTDTEVL